MQRNTFSTAIGAIDYTLHRYDLSSWVCHPWNNWNERAPKLTTLLSAAQLIKLWPQEWEIIEIRNDIDLQKALVSFREKSFAIKTYHSIENVRQNPFKFNPTSIFLVNALLQYMQYRVSEIWPVLIYDGRIWSPGIRSHWRSCSSVKYPNSPKIGNENAHLHILSPGYIWSYKFEYNLLLAVHMTVDRWRRYESFACTGTTEWPSIQT